MAKIQLTECSYGPWTSGRNRLSSRTIISGQIPVGRQFFSPRTSQIINKLRFVTTEEAQIHAAEEEMRIAAYHAKY